jgi:hypothetical protein
MVTLPIYADLAHVEPGHYQRVVRLHVPGEHDFFLERRFPLEVLEPRETPLVVTLAVIATTALGLALAFALRQRIFSHFRSRDLVLASLAGATDFALVALPEIVFFNVLHALLGPLSVVLTGALTGALHFGLLACLLVLAPRRGMIALVLMVRLLLSGIVMGQLSLVAILYAATTVFLLEGALCVAPPRELRGRLWLLPVLLLAAAQALAVLCELPALEDALSLLLRGLVRGALGAGGRRALHDRRLLVRPPVWVSACCVCRDEDHPREPHLSLSRPHGAVARPARSVVRARHDHAAHGCDRQRQVDAAQDAERAHPALVRRHARRRRAARRYVAGRAEQRGRVPARRPRLPEPGRSGVQHARAGRGALRAREPRPGGGGGGEASRPRRSRAPDCAGSNRRRPRRCRVGRSSASRSLPCSRCGRSWWRSTSRCRSSTRAVVRHPRPARRARAPERAGGGAGRAPARGGAAVHGSRGGARAGQDPARGFSGGHPRRHGALRAAGIEVPPLCRLAEQLGLAARPLDEASASRCSRTCRRALRGRGRRRPVRRSSPRAQSSFATSAAPIRRSPSTRSS